MLDFPSRPLFFRRWSCCNKSVKICGSLIFHTVHYTRMSRLTVNWETYFFFFAAGEQCTDRSGYPQGSSRISRFPPSPRLIRKKIWIAVDYCPFDCWTAFLACVSRFAHACVMIVLVHIFVATCVTVEACRELTSSGYSDWTRRCICSVWHEPSVFTPREASCALALIRLMMRRLICAIAGYFSHDAQWRIPVCVILLLQTINKNSYRDGH